jgi:hypothetical protein
MSDSRQRTEEPELIGIIISQGFRTDAPPRFSAYVWGSAPAESKVSNSTRAA